MKLALLADLHIGFPETQFPGQSYEFAADVLRRAVPLIEVDDPDELVVVGDLVNMGTAAEFRLANELLAPFAHRLRVIPGNHDLVDASLSDFGVRLTGASVNELSDDGAFVRVFLNTGIERLTVSRWHGVLADEAIAQLDRGIALARGRPLLVFAHHPPAGTVRLHDPHPMMTLTNGHELLDRLFTARVPAVVFCGHNHCGDVWRHRNVTVVGLPSLSFWPHAYVIADYSDGLLTLSENRVISSPDESPHEKSRTSTDYRRWAESSVPSLAIRLA